MSQELEVTGQILESHKDLNRSVGQGPSHASIWFRNMSQHARLRFTSDSTAVSSGSPTLYLLCYKNSCVCGTYRLSISPLIKTLELRVEEMTQWLGVLEASSEDPDLVPSTHSAFTAVL